MNRLNKLAIISSAVLGATFFGSSAMAQAAPNGTLTGAVTASKGITLNCTLTLNLDAANNTGTIALTAGDALCGALNFNSQPYTTSYSGGVLTFHNVDVTTVSIGDCAGNISGTWDGSVLIIDNATLPAKTAGAPCKIDGYAL